MKSLALTEETGMKTRKYQMPDFLTPTLTQERYERWLSRKASAHVKRDKERGNRTVNREKYKIAIHDAVIKCGACDYYTGEQLGWSMLSSPEGRGVYIPELYQHAVRSFGLFAPRALSQTCQRFSHRSGHQKFRSATNVASVRRRQNHTHPTITNYAMWRS
jgi:hypothetical protein